VIQAIRLYLCPLINSALEPPPSPYFTHNQQDTFLVIAVLVTVIRFFVHVTRLYIICIPVGCNRVQF
jgi:hypothetical protein